MSHFDRIVVVGGGVAGWMSALALVTGLRGQRVEVVESEEIGTVGVGEATFPSIRDYNRIVGIDEAEFLRATQGTYKLGVEFRDWRRPGDSYFHTFGDFGQLSGSHSLWGQHRRLRAAAPGPLAAQCLPSVMAAQGRFCAPEVIPGAPFKYAYHFDASLYANFLKRMAMQRGVRRTEGRIVDVRRREDGGVRSLRLADGRDVDGDLFIDCSGFRSLLLGGALAEPFVDFSHWLPVDRAWACPCERDGADITPYTRATALEGGWSWRIPLQHRTGHGHVFSTRYIDEERAREQLLQGLDGKPLAEPRLLRFSTGGCTTGPRAAPRRHRGPGGAPAVPRRLPGAGAGGLTGGGRGNRECGISFFALVVFVIADSARREQNLIVGSCKRTTTMRPRAREKQWR